jgi:hypothetical protein
MTCLRLPSERDPVPQFGHAPAINKRESCLEVLDYGRATRMDRISYADALGDRMRRHARNGGLDPHSGD